MLEEQNPQYRFKTDFVNVSAMSTLTLAVFQRPSFTASTMGKIPFVHKVRRRKGIEFLRRFLLRACPGA